jgi:hypothetical protein
MNQSQIASTVRWLVTAFGAVIAGYIAGKGWASANDVLGVLSSDTFIQGVGAVIALVSLVWGLFRHTQTNQVAAVNRMDTVAGVITKDTPEGKQLAKAVPSSTVATEGTAAAKAVAAYWKP